MMRAFFAILLFSTSLLLSGCQKDALCSDCVRLQYAQTQCADAWGYGTDGSDAQVELAVRDFFVSNGVQVHTVSVSGEAAGIICHACTCLTGKTIYVLTPASYRGDFEAYGFY